MERRFQDSHSNYRSRPDNGSRRGNYDNMNNNADRRNDSRYNQGGFYNGYGNRNNRDNYRNDRYGSGYRDNDRRGNFGRDYGDRYGRDGDRYGRDNGGYGGQGRRNGGFNNGPDNFRRRSPNWRNNNGPRRNHDIPEVDDSPVDPETFYSYSGVLELHPNGYGFLRDPKANYDRQRSDPFVPGSLVDKFCLREGLLITGKVQPERKTHGPRLMEIIDIDGLAPEEYMNVKTFDEMVPINPNEWLRLETGREPVSTRVMDMLTPLGKGQRALIVAPPRSGKTVLLQQISQAITANYPDVHVIILLIDERPEEVTDFRRVVKNAEVVASSLDNELESHVRLAQFIIERCKRLAEMGKDVFLLLDSITRLARAFNKWVGNTGRTMTGGIDIKAMDIPKKIFSSARLNEGGGSLTIVGTALIDTGSRMDELIYQEFKGTGNMELVLDRRLAERRVWPAIDISQSGTRREEKLLPPETLRAVNMLRRVLTPMNPMEAMEMLSNRLSQCESNAEFMNKFMKYGE